MGQIEEYNQQVAAPEAFGTSSPNTELAGAEGKAIANFGEEVREFGQVVEKRHAQQETSDVYSGAADLRAQYTERIQQQTQDGTLDVDKLQEDFDNDIQKLGQNLSTPAGRNYFERQQARLKGNLTQMATSSRAVLASNEAKAKWSNAVDKSSSSLLKDPSSFQDVLEQSVESIDNMIESGGFPAKMRDKAINEMGTEYATAAVRGWIDKDPDFAEKSLKNGVYDKFIDQDRKHQLVGEIRQARNAQEIEAQRAERLKEKAQKAAQGKTQNDFLKKMQDGGLSAKDILNSNLDAFGSGSKEQFLQMLKKANEPENKLKPDGAVIKNLFDRIHLPDGDPNKLTDENELNNYLANGLDFENLNRMRDELQGQNTQAGKQEADMKRQVYEIAKGQLTKSNSMTGLRDPYGDEQFAKWNAQFLDQFTEQRKEGVPARELLDPSSPKYLGRTIDAFKRSQKQIIKDLTGSRTRTPGSGIAKNPAMHQDTTQSTQPPATYTPPKKEVVARKPGESPADYLKRKKAGG